MIQVRKAEERGQTRWDWLDSRHTFSFGEYYDPRNQGFRSLRVLNDDRVDAGAGFGTHGHRDMEILSYVLEGALQHKDSSGGGGVIRPGEIQFMRAGRGVAHSEYNHSPAEPVHFLQIWIVPAERGLPPRYDQHPFDEDAAGRRLVLLASRDGREGTIQLNQDVDLFVTRPGAGEVREHALAEGRAGYVHVARGSAVVNGQRMAEGDGARIEGEPRVEIRGDEDAEVLLFDLA